MAPSCVRKVLCVLYAVLLVAVALSQTHRGTFSSFKSPKETILNYETLLPVVEWTTRDPSYQLIVTLNSTTTRYTLKLQLNVGLLSTSFSSRYHEHNGKEGIQMGHRNCFYHGEVVEEKEWSVVLSTCLGLRGSFGPRGDPTQRYHIEPLHYHTGSTDLMQPHVLYLGSEYTTAAGTCGTKGHGGGEMPQHIHVTISQERPRLRRQGSFAIVEWTLVNDNTQYLTFSSNLTLVVLRAIEIANGVDELFRVEGVRVVVVDVITWTMGNPIEVTGNPGRFLDNFRRYSPNLPQNYDSAMLFTGIEFNGTTIGIAFTATMCEYLRSSVGIVQDGGGQIDQLVSTTAHELGHIFAMDHDISSCTCSDKSFTCIMEETLGFPPPTTWSSCSVETLRRSLGSELGLCLDNVPATTVTDAICGNGIQEEGEACDCGSAEECVDRCCNSTLCQLVAGAECRAGTCCQSDCQLKKYGTVCRRESNECDIEEYCTGDSADCPRDLFVQNLTPCMNNASFCFSGQCRTRESQCQHHFNTGDAIDACYIRVNTLGSVYGHCGFSDGDYVPCLERNAFCGQLQCRNDGELQTSPGFSARFTLFPESFTCNSVTTVANGDEISPGLVQDGTKCGDEMVCFNMECVNTSALGIPLCPVDSNGEVCSGKGQCNSENHCSCSVGFQGSRCGEVVGSRGGEGGGGGGNGGVIAGAVISVILVLAIIGGVTALVIYLVLRSKSASNTYSTRRVNYRASAASTNITSSNGMTPPPISKPPPPPTSVAPTEPHPSAPPRPHPPTQPNQPIPLRPQPPARPTTSAPPRPHPPTHSKPSPGPKRPPPPSRPPARPSPLTTNNTPGGVKPTRTVNNV